jgi:signal transduction histidine kinase/ActR/RegA family two-component response regulator
MRKAQPLSRRMAVAGLAVCAAVLVPAVVEVAALNSADDARATERDAARVTSAIGVTERLVIDLETGQRGFVITGDPEFLQPWTTARRMLPARLAALRSLSASSRGKELASTISAAVEEYLRVYSIPLVAVARDDRSAARSRVRTQEGKTRVDNLRDLFAQLDATQRQRTQDLDDRADAAATRARVVLAAGLLIALGVLAFFAVFLARDVVGPLRRMTAVAARRGAGDLDVRARPEGARELVELAEAFNDMVGSLQTSQRELVKASDAKSEFLSRMSHELRTPLNAILGFGQLLEMDGLGADQAASVKQILSAGRHLLALIDEVLEISRIEAGSVRISVEPVAMRSVIADIQSMVAPMAAKRGITVEVDPTGCDKFAQADQQRVKQILLNLLSNAINYNREGGNVTVRCASDEHVFQVSVSDTGPGIADADRERLFVPFERLGADATHVDGTGLGLALSQRFAELMDGTLEVAESSAAGTTFVLTLPLADVAALIPIHAPQPAPAMPAEGRMTVVHVEDNPSNAELVERIFAQHRPVRLLSAVQGNRALELVREHHPQLVLLDLHLPDVPGDEVLAQLKADPETASIPVVIISADATQGHVSRLLRAGAAAYLTKPLDVREFLAAVDAATGVEAL